MAPDPEINALPRELADEILRLPEHLLERLRVVSVERRAALRSRDAAAPLADGPVVYWTHHAQRVDENPALDVARLLARALDRPLLVYQGLSQSYRYASDRHHGFQLESAQELCRAYRDMGIRYVLHVETESDATPSLLRLAQSASLMVTEDFPGEPTDRWVERIAHVRGLSTLAVDTACIVPMRLVGRAFDRAFAFRDATQSLYRERIERPWPAVEVRPRSFDGHLPFVPLDMDAVDCLDLVARCRIDHGVPPVADTRGGSAQGYRRWEAFVAHSLKQYAAKRNDPLSGVASRMSAYLHYGMVSPMALARQARAMRAEKYLDELLIWRELAYGFCFYRPEHATTRALPQWAIQTLRDHESDPRSALPSWETLSRARTEDDLWNACQESLVRHGELHNNVRMTWGKALLGWTRNAQHALELLIDLNHRYALDGRDPASYGGILWCLGQFDRPFYPEQPVLGTVRGRPTREHAQRMRLDAYIHHVRRPISAQSMRVAVIGAGVAGSMCARTLADHGVDVALIEKSRGPGGRCATRRLGDNVLVDHGVPCVEFTDSRWDWFVQSWHHDGVIEPWLGTQVRWFGRKAHPDPGARTRWVGVGGINAIGKHLCRDLQCLAHHRVVGVDENQSQYCLQVEVARSDEGTSNATLGPFDAIVFAIPIEQARTLVPRGCSWRDRLPQRAHQPCWTAMMIFEHRWDVPFDGARCADSGLAWLGRESSKPGRARDPDAWVVQMDGEWSSRYLECDSEEVLDRILEQLRDAGLPPVPGILHRQTHRWRYAQASESIAGSGESAPFDCLWDPRMRLGACGDGFGTTGVEGALASGRALAGRILNGMVSHGPCSATSAERGKSGGYVQRELF